MTTFKAPNLNGPRFRYKVKNILNRKLFDKFLDKHPNYKGKLELKEFKDVVHAFNKTIQDEVINYKYGVELPESLGYLIVARCNKPKKLNPDFKNSIKYGKLISHRNWDSDDYIAKICYSNYSMRYRFADKELWGFTPTKQFRKNVSKAFSEMYNSYIYLDNKIKLSDLYKNI